MPTGWEVTLDLVRRVAKLRGQDPGADPADWYEREYGSAPEYSDLLSQLGGTASERLQILREYFEPTIEERSGGQKLPTPAHRAIAKLVSKGYVRVLLTTNFDRLLELALADEGIQSAVITSPNGARGALPLAHTRCTIIKVNGDYLDPRFKNTGRELAAYDPAVNQLLDQVFDEYGLVICGWSGASDIALCAAIERCPVRRFTTYWTTITDLSQTAAAIADKRQAQLLPITNADDFFTTLADNVTALEDLRMPDLISASVARARLKRYLADNDRLIQFHDLLLGEADKTTTALLGPNFDMITEPRVDNRLRRYETCTNTLLYLMTCGAYWAKPHHDTHLLRGFKRVADLSQRSGHSTLLALRRYPALLLLYGMGLSALAAQNFRFLHAILHVNVEDDPSKPQRPAAIVINSTRVLSPQSQEAELARQQTPLCNWVFAALREPLREFLPNDSDYDRTFDFFEYVLCLTHCDLKTSRGDLNALKQRDPEYRLIAPVGRFGWKAPAFDGAQIDATMEMHDGAQCPPQVRALIDAGFFDSTGNDYSKYRGIKAGFDRHLKAIREQLI